MSDQDGLLRAILDRPDDDAHRLVYADWLEENGDARRAGFIRAQMELADLPDHDPRWVRFRRDFRDRNDPGYPNLPLPRVPEASRWAPFCYRRGFPWKLQVFDLGTFLREVPGLFDRAPIGALDVDGRDLKDLSPLARSPWLGRIERLEFSLGEFGPKLIGQLLDSPHLGRLRELAFEFGAIDAGGLRLLLSSPLASRLRLLGLRSNFFGEHGRALGDAFRAAAPMPALESLDLADNRIGYDSIQPLVGRVLTPALRELNLGGNALPGDVFLAVASGAFPCLETLRLEKTKPGRQGAATLAGLGDGLGALHLGSCGLGPVAVGSLAGSDQLSGLRVLGLGDNPVGDTGALALARSPHLTQLVSLDLRRAGVTGAGVRALLDSPTLSGLIALDLRDDALSAALVKEVRGRFGRFSASDPIHRRARKPRGKAK